MQHITISNEILETYFLVWAKFIKPIKYSVPHKQLSIQNTPEDSVEFTSELRMNDQAVLWNNLQKGLISFPHTASSV
jgi:hypothetical protein